MKKIILIVSILLIVCGITPVFANQDETIVVNGKTYSLTEETESKSQNKAEEQNNYVKEYKIKIVNKRRNKMKSFWENYLLQVVFFSLFAVIIIFSISDLIINKNITSKENIVDTVQIVDSYENTTGGTMTLVGKTLVCTPSTTHYNIVVEHKGKEYKIDNYNTYKQFKDKKGQNVKAMMEKITYKDKKIKYEIKNIYEEN